MKIFIGSDHAGYDLKESLKKFLISLNHDVVDCGAYEYDAEDDYPDFVKKVAEEVLNNPDSKGIILGKSGQGEAMCANRFRGIRAALYYGGPKEIIELSRAHNDSNILSLGAGFLNATEAEQAVSSWFGTVFSGDERHVRRVTMFS